MIWLLLYVATIPLANWTITTFGLVPVGFGLLAPAGVYFAGLAFTLRDLTQDALGKWPTLGAVLGGAALSWFVADPFVAAASGVAFLVSELADLLVYTPLKERGWLRAVTASNAAGLVVDSALFLFVAFGSLAFLPGQIVGKLWVTLVFVAALWLARRYRVVGVVA